MRSHVLLLAFLSFALSSFSQQAEFQRIFGNDLDNRFNKVVREGGFFYALGTDEPNEGVTPHATLTKLNSQGQIQWTIRMGVPSVWNDIVVTDEGNLLLVGGTMPYDLSSHSLMGLATPAGNMLWVNTYNLSSRETLSKVVRHPNPDNPDFPYYVLGAFQQLNATTNDDVHLINIDANGGFNWRKVFGTSSDEEFFRDLEVLANGNLLIVGHQNNTAVSLVVNKQGSVVTGNSYNSSMRIYDAVERPDGGFFLGGSSGPSSPAQLSRLNASFQPVWSRTISQLSFINRIWIGPDNALYALGFGNIGGVNKNVAVKIVESNNLPTVLWTKVLDGAETAFTNGNFFYLPPGQIGYVDGRTGNPAGFGQSDAFLSVSNLDLGTCITLPGPTLSLSSFNLASSSYFIQDNPNTITGVQPSAFQGLAWQQSAVCGSSCEPVNTNTYSTITLPVTGTSEIELAIDGFQASNGEHVAVGLSTAFSPFTLDLVFYRFDEEGNLISDPQRLDFMYNGGDLEALIDAETQANVHMTEVFDGSGNSQGYFLAATMFNTVFPPGGVSTLDVMAALLDHQGCVVWSRFMERTNTDEQARDVLQLPNSDLAVLVQRVDPSIGENAMEILRFSLNGQTCSDLVYSLPSTDDFYPSAIANIDGLPNPAATVAVGGYWKSGQRFMAVYLLQSDLTLATPGALLYDMLSANPEETPYPAGIVQKGENLVIAGYMSKNSPDREAFITEIRPFTPTGQVDGFALWTRRLRTIPPNSTFGNGFRIYGLEKTADDDLVVAGVATGANDSFYRAFMMKTNPTGAVQWINVYPGGFGEELAANALAYDIDVAPSGELLLTGYRPRPDSSDGFFWVARTDPNGNMANCECFDPLTLQVENILPAFSQTTSPEPTPIDCAGGLAIPACTAFMPEQLFCDQNAPEPVCEALFNWEPLDECGTISFTNQSTGAVPTFLWQFGDPFNSASTELNAEFTYLLSGVYTVCLTVTTAECTETWCQEITVEIAGAPAALACPDNITIQVDPGACENTTYQLPEAAVTDNCPCDPVLDVSYPAGYQGPYAIGQNTFTVTAIDGCGLVTCEVTVTVDDGEAPVITCPEDIVLQFGSPTSPSATGEATAADPCGDAILTFEDETLLSSECFTRIQRTWTASDGAGNASTCTQIIELDDLTPLELVCPGNVEVVAAPGDCSAVPVTGAFEFVDDCISYGTLEFGLDLSGATTASGFGFDLLNMPFELGVTLVEAWAVEIPGAYASCEFTVTVTELTPPTIECPEVICALAPPGANEAVVEWDEPEAEDNCGIASLVCTPASGSVFPLGASEVTCVVTDISGNEASCTFTIVVQPGDFSAGFSAEETGGCGDVFQFTPQYQEAGYAYAWDFGDGNSSSEMTPQHSFSSGGDYLVVLAVTAPNGCEAFSIQTVTVELLLEPAFTYEINCNTATFTGTPAGASWSWNLPGGTQQGAEVTAVFPGPGSFDICATATEGDCSIEVCQTIEVQPDTEAPTLTCADQTVPAETDFCHATLEILPEASDNCSPSTEITLEGLRDDGLALGEPWSLGTTCITWTATDQAGNQGVCTQCITVVDEQAPVITCPEDVTAEADPATGTAVVTFDEAVATDNCDGLSQNCTHSSGEEFPLGSTLVTCTATDASGNESSCSFQVIVLPEGDLCETQTLDIRTGYDYASGVLFGGNGVADPYWQETNGLPMTTATTAGGIAPLASTHWLVPMTTEGYRDHRVAFKFCLPEAPFDCQDLVFDLGIQAWAQVEVSINGRPASGPLFEAAAFGGAVNWNYTPSAADCELFRAGDNYLTLDFRTVYGGAGISVLGTVSSTNPDLQLGIGGCCTTSPACSCEEFLYDNIAVIPSSFYESNPCVRAFRPAGIEDCDQVEWYLNATLIATGTGSGWVFMNLPNGSGEVCLRVTRTDGDGNFCGVIEKCWPFIMQCGQDEDCNNTIVANTGMEGEEGLLGQGGSAEPWQQAFGNPWVSSGAGAGDSHFMIISGNAGQSDAFYQELAPQAGQVYEVSLNAIRYLPGRPGEGTSLVIRASDQPQTSTACTGNCQTIAVIEEFSDTTWYHYTHSWQPLSAGMKYLTIFVQNDNPDDGLPASRSYIQIDNVCIDIPSSLTELSPESGFRIFPNPAGSGATLSFTETTQTDLQLTLYDLWGRSVLSALVPAGTQQTSIDLALLPPAVYWVEVRGEEGKVGRVRLVKQ
jgi:PKD repeat protein